MEPTNQHFGILIAYLLPGFLALAGLAVLVPALGDWLQPATGSGTGIGPPVYAVLVATALGMILSCFRWLLIDHLLYWLGVRPPEWNAEQLDRQLSTFSFFVEYHYRYYQFYGNTLLALIAVYGLNRWLHTWPMLGLGTDAVVLVLCLVLLAGARDALIKYYRRTARIVAKSRNNIQKEKLS